MNGDRHATWQIEVEGETTSAVFEPALSAGTDTLYICAHGSGGHMSDKAMLAATNALRSTGLDVVRFNFVYREKGSNRPDPMPRLEACVAAVTEHARASVQPKRVILGGRSMGG